MLALVGRRFVEYRAHVLTEVALQLHRPLTLLTRPSAAHFEEPVWLRRSECGAPDDDDDVELRSRRARVSPTR
jgi:hypothetical protein